MSFSRGGGLQLGARGDKGALAWGEALYGRPGRVCDDSEGRAEAPA